ncbi:hypothetical protein PENSPDRAFT_654082 [Peniophora sp. CONT]|nr:hypothetical protein PENSPDRAFT_654082 [Peniophora sp. CONT]
MDSTIRLWARPLPTISRQKSFVRSLTIHSTEFSFASGSAGGNNIKKWKYSDGNFVFNLFMTQRYHQHRVRQRRRRPVQR